MKTQQQAQKIFNILVNNLEEAASHNLFHSTRNSKEWFADFMIDTPLEDFLTSTRKLTEADLSQEFLRQVYAEAFHTGPIPKDRNHIAFNCYLQVNAGPTSPVLSFWIDLDKVATKLNTHLRIYPPYRFEVKYYSASRSSSYGGSNFINTTLNSAVNSVFNPQSISTSLLLGCIVGSSIGSYALLIAALAATLLITLSTAGIFTAIGVGLALAGAATSHYFFKNRDYIVNTSIEPIEESKPENIEDIFRDHFAATIDKATSLVVPVEIIAEQALSI